ncbi:MAG: tryptophan synthase subunit alpha [Nitrospinota bacterium]|nr:MAG: tryptophan synthase subunit alpha [Nitrospinota bacterium]
MGRIETVFTRLRRTGKKALIPFLMAGDPDLEQTAALLLELEKRGADLIELGVPFSDPIADGPIIQRAAQRALGRGTSLTTVLDLVSQLRSKTGVPLILLTYYNPVFRYGEERFVQDALQAGVDGVIIPDLPPEEGRSLLQRTAETDLDLVCLLAPTSPPERIALIARVSQGFIYYVSRTGITGIRERLAEDLRTMLTRIRAVTDKPVAVGFGISNPAQAQVVASFADGVIVGSALIKVIEEHLGDFPATLQKLGTSVAALRQAIDTVG